MSPSLLFLLYSACFFFILLWCFVRLKVCGHAAVVLWAIASRIFWKHYASFLCSSHLPFFFMRFLNVQMVLPYSSIDQSTHWKKADYILSKWSDFRVINSLSTSVHTLGRHMLTTPSVDEILLTRYANSFTNFLGLPLRMLKNTLFYLRCLLLLCSRYAVGIPFWQAYLQEVLDYLHNLHLSQFLRDIVCFLIFSLDLVMFVIGNLSRL